MSAPPRQLKITYGTTAASGTLSGATLTLHDVHSISITPDDFSVSYSVLVSASTESVFASGVAAFESAMSTRRQAFKVESGSHDLLSLSHAGNTGLNITAEISKPGGPADTVLSRIYEVTVSGGLPTKAALSGLRDFSYDVTFSPSQRGTLTVRGEYTALGSNQASEQYLTSIDARVLSITTALTGVWELTSETYTPDDTDQVVSFTRVYEEQIFTGVIYIPGGGTSPAIVDQLLSITSDRVGSEGLSEERKLLTITANYSAGVTKDADKSLEDLWEQIIRPWLISQVSEVAGDRFAIVSQSVTYEQSDKRISVVLVAQARSGGDILSKVLTDVLEIETGVILARTWPTGSPGRDEPTDAYVYQGPKTIRRTLTEETTTLGTIEPKKIRTRIGGGRQAPRRSPLGVFGVQSRGGEGSLLANDPGGAILISRSETVNNRSLGLPGEKIVLFDKAVVEIYEYANQIRSGAGAARTRTR